MKNGHLKYAKSDTHHGFQDPGRVYFDTVKVASLSIFATIH